MDDGAVFFPGKHAGHFLKNSKKIFVSYKNIPKNCECTQ
jgi:hypothetical protein